MTQNYIKVRVTLPNNNESNLFTYVPLAGYANPGIVAFDENYFSINNDTHIVTLKFSGQYYTKTEVDTLLFEKVEKTDQSFKLYGTDNVGAQTIYTLSRSQNDVDSVPWRYQGRLPGINDPVDSLDAANKRYIDTGLSIKVNKLSEIGAPAVYIGNPNGTQTYKYLDNFALGDSVPLRDSSGNIYVGTATQSGHAVNKGYVDTTIAEQISRVYKPAGTMTFAELISTVVPSESTLGNVYNISDSFVTTAAFIEGTGKSYGPGENVVIIQFGNSYYYDVLSSSVDLSNYVTKTDYATKTKAGIGKVDPDYGIEMRNGEMFAVNPAVLSEIKAGTSSRKPVACARLDQSVFYALAKAAGANLASSTEETAPDGTNPGVYPEVAKVAIASLFGTDSVGTIYLDPDDWVNNSQTVYVGTFTAEADMQLTPITNADELRAQAAGLSVTPHVGSLTFYCTTVPTSEISFRYSIIH